MKKILPVSIIIPIKGAEEDAIGRLFRAICNQTAWPSEIILVNANNENDDPFGALFNQGFDNSVKIKTFSASNAYPGKARNIGVRSASQPMIAFLDLMTIPNPSWLEQRYERINQHDYDGIIGGCKFIGQTFFSWILIDGLFGRGIVSTLPGSIFTRKALDRVGPMLEKTRSGEDNEWLQRAKLMSVRFLDDRSFSACDYFGYSKITFFDFCKKWAKNYWHAALLPQYKLIQQFNLIVWAIAVTSIAFNWNAFFAEWEDSHPMYIPHITKTAIALILSLYFFLRGVYLPVSRGSPIRKILCPRLILIICTTCLADFIKSACFLASTFKKRLAVN